MNKATILVIGENDQRHTALVETLGNQFYSLTANNEEAAIDRFLQTPVDAVIFGEDVSEAVKAKLTKIFSTQDDTTVFVNDNSNRNMAEEISQAISSKQKENKPAFSFKDDALKNAGLNIQIQ